MKHPKTAPTRVTKTMEEFFPAPDRFVNYRLVNIDDEKLVRKCTEVLNIALTLLWIYYCIDQLYMCSGVYYIIDIGHICIRHS